MPTPTEEDMMYADALRWANWAIHNGEAGGTMGDITSRAIARMGLPEPRLEMYNRLLLAITRMVMNGTPLECQGDPEPKPYRKRLDRCEKVDLMVKTVKPILVTPPPKLLN